METEEFLREVTALPGVTGNERKVAEYVAAAFKDLVDDVEVDALNCVYAHKKGNGPRVMVCAHLDEIGGMVEKIEDDGGVRFSFVGGVDPRVMPGMRVRVCGKETLQGVVGAKAPHLLSAQEKEKNYAREEMFIDLGMPADEIKKVVSVGDNVCFDARFMRLLNDRYVTKTADDRACVAIMLRAAELMKKMSCEADVTFVATCQEEIGCYGAKVAGYKLDPDFGVAFDVCHGITPGADKYDTFELDSLVAAKGPFINPYLRKKLDEVAAAQNVTLQTDVDPRSTGTDADTLTLARAGVPTILFSLPLKYMHTNVELLSMKALKEGARLLAAYLCAVDSTWEAELWT